MKAAEIRESLPVLLREQGLSTPAVVVAHSGRPVAAADIGGHGAVQAGLPRPARSRVHARDHVSEVRAYDRHRHHRHDGTASQLLRDARQLQLRRLLQERGVRVGVRVLDRGARARSGPPVVLDLRGRRRGRGDLARRGRRAGRSHRAHGRQGQLLVGRAHRPVRPVLGALLRPGSGSGLRLSGLRAGLRLRPVPRVLEPRVHAVRPRRGRHAHAASEAEHRHRHGPRARRGHHAGRALELRDRHPAAASSHSPRRSPESTYGTDREDATRRCASSPTTRVP